jgi:hypothetical protein|tara:strand:- start:652 stop:1482 length:831 start_codon:yes stop_codon:yes gene_type:complete
MANKKKETKVEEPMVEETVVVKEQPKVEAPKAKAKPRDTWEVRDRVYVLNGQAPLAYHLKTKGLFWFDEEKGYEREVGYSRNQRTVFVDEMKGVKRPEHVWFRDGVLSVPKEKVALQKLLSLYHPHRGKKYHEVDEQRDAANHVDYIELELEAMNLAKSLSFDEIEAIMRVEVGSGISKMSSAEIKRDALVMSRRTPSLFIDLANDPNIRLRNTGIKATEMGIIKLSSDQRTFMWGSNDRKLMTVPFDEHPYSALAAWFKTDEGMEVLSSIEKRIN